MKIDRAQEIGETLIDVLGLKVKGNGRVETSIGDKTPMGLARIVERILDENTPRNFYHEEST